MFSLTCARINGWVNNREAGDLRRRRAHYDVIVMKWQYDVYQDYIPGNGCLATCPIQRHLRYSYNAPETAAVVALTQVTETRELI